MLINELKLFSNAAANNGVMLWAENEDTDGYDLRFYSSETANSVDRPYLEVTWSQTAKTVYFLKDHLGSIRATVDETGAVVGYDDYDPWGKEWPPHVTQQLCCVYCNFPAR